MTLATPGLSDLPCGQNTHLSLAFTFQRFEAVDNVISALMCNRERR